MSSEHTDGSIVIDTELDNTGFDKWSKRLKNTVQSLCSDLENMGTRLMNVMQESVVPALNVAADNTAYILSIMRKNADLAASVNKQTAESEQQITQEARNATQAIQQQATAAKDVSSAIGQAQKGTGTAGQSVDAYAAKIEKLQAKIDVQKSKMADYYTALNDIQNPDPDKDWLRGVNDEEQIANALKVEELAIDALNKKYADKLTILKNLENELARLKVLQQEAAAAPKEIADSAAVKAFSNEVGKADTMITGYQAKVEKMQSLGAKETAWQSIQYDIGAAKTKLDEYKAKLEEFNSSGNMSAATYERLSNTISRLTSMQSQISNVAASMGQIVSDDSRAKALATELEKIGKEISGYQAKAEKMQTMGAKSSAWKNIQYDIDATKSKLDEYKAKLDQLNASGGISTESYERLSGTLSRLTETQGNLSSLASSMTQTSAAGSRVNVFLGNFGSAMKSAANKAVSLTKSMARIPFVAMKNGTKAVISKLREFTANSRNTESSTKSLVKSLTSLKTTMVSRVKRMFISAIFSQMKEALNSLAKFSSTFNSAMSSLKNNATQLSANMAVSLGNLIASIEPILTKIISALSTAMSYLNAFFAMLGGKNTVTVARKQTASYAASLDKTTDSAEKAGKAVQELKNQIMGFDEINRMEKQDDSSSDTGSSPSTSIDPNGGDLFEQIPIDSMLPAQVKAYFDRLKAAIQAGDWEGVGRIIAEGLNTGMAIVDNWINTVLRPMGVLWAGRVAEILNGLTDGFDWKLFGKTLADGMNAAFDILNTFLTTYNFEQLGSKVGTAIKSWFANVEWDLIGQTFANKWNALIDFIYGLVTTPGIWWQIGDSLGTFINNLFLTIKFDKAMQAMAAGFNGIFTTIRTISNTVKWDEIAQSITNGLNTFIYSIHWRTAGISLSNFVMNLLGVFKQVADNTNWEEFGRGIGNFLASIDWPGILTTVGDIIWQAAGGVIAGLLDTSAGKIILAMKIGIWAVPKLFSAAKPALINAVTGWITAGAGKFTLLISAATKLVSGLSGILSTIGSVLFSPTGLLVAGIAIGVIAIITHWDQIKDAAGKLKDALSEKWSQIKDAASNLWQGVKETISTKFTQAKDAVVQTASNLGSRLSGAWSNIKSTASSMWENVKSTVTSKFTQTNGLLSGTAQNMQSTLSQKFSGILSNSSRIFENLRGTLDRASQNSNSAVVRQFASMASNMISNMSSAARSIQNQGWASVGSNICSGIQSGINRGWSWLSSTVSNLASSLLRSAKSALGIHSPSRLFRDEVGENIGLGWAEGIEGTEATVLKTVANVAKGITENADAEIPEIQYSGDTLLTGLDAVANKLSEVAAIFQNIGNMIATTGGLKIPATECMVPYKTRIEDEKVQVTDPTALSTVNSSQTDLIVSVIQQTAEAIIEAIEEKDLIIGDGAIYEANKHHSKMLSMMRGTI